MSKSELVPVENAISVEVELPRTREEAETLLSKAVLSDAAGKWMYSACACYAQEHNDQDIARRIQEALSVSARTVQLLGTAYQVWCDMGRPSLDPTRVVRSIGLVQAVDATVARSVLEETAHIPSSQLPSAPEFLRAFLRHRLPPAVRQDIEKRLARSQARASEVKQDKHPIKESVPPEVHTLVLQAVSKHGSETVTTVLKQLLQE